MARPRDDARVVGEGDRPAVGQRHEVGLAPTRRRGARAAPAAAPARGVGAGGGGQRGRRARRACGAGVGAPASARARRALGMLSRGGETTWSSGTEKRLALRGLEQHQPAAPREPRHRDLAPVLQDQGLLAGRGRGGAPARDRVERRRHDLVLGHREDLALAWSGRATCPSRRASRVTGILRPSFRTSTSSAARERRDASEDERAPSEPASLRARIAHSSGCRGNFTPGQAHARGSTSWSRAPLGRGLEAGGARGGDQVVLVDAVAADADGAGEPAALVERDAAREDRDPVRQARARGHAARAAAGVQTRSSCRPVLKGLHSSIGSENAPGSVPRDAGREEGLGQEADRARACRRTLPSSGTPSRR